jgi:alpha-glucuronidase
MLKQLFCLVFFSVISFHAFAENGYELWLRYVKINDAALNRNYRMVLKQLVFPDTPPTLQAARQELNKGLAGMLNISPNAR